MSELDLLEEELLKCYVYQKVRLLEESGLQGHVDTDRLRDLAVDRIKKMAPIVDEFHVRPDIAMEAVFSFAIRQKHPDGPMPNMLGSKSYIAKALSHYMQVPYAVVMERRSDKLFISKRDFAYDETEREMDQAGITDLATATSYPVECRYLMAINRGDWDAVFYISQELLSAMESDSRVSHWMAHKGVTYTSAAKVFNSMLKQRGFKK